MIDLENYRIGLFHETNATTYNELGDSNFKVKNEREYASTSTNNVVLLLNKNNEVVDIDDIPVESTFELLDERFVAFLQGEKVCAFVVNKDDIFLGDEDFIKTNSQGLLTYVKILSDDFDLEATLDIDNTININDLEDKDMLLLYLEASPKIIRNETKSNVYLFMGCAKLLKTNLD